MSSLKLKENVLRRFSEDIRKKSVPAINEPDLVKEFFCYIQMQNEFIEKSSAYEVASTLRSFGTWYENKYKEPQQSYARQREVYYVDLGAFNLKYEEGFIHPCMVLERYGTSVIVIPGSTKSYGRKDPLIFDIEAGNGFKENTGLLLDQIRCVSTIRLRSKLKHGKVNTDTFNLITERFMEKFFSKKFQEFGKIKKDLDQFKVDLDTMKKENEELKMKIEEYNLVTNE